MLINLAYKQSHGVKKDIKTAVIGI
jgi:hypothetical protein